MCGKSCVFQSKLSVIRAQCLIDGPCREEEAALLVTAQPHRMDSQRHVSLSSALFSGFHVFLCNTSLLHIQPDTTLVFTVFTVTRKWIILKTRHPISDINWCSKCLILTRKTIYDPNGSRWKVCPSVLSVYYDTFLYHVLYCIFKQECIHTCISDSFYYYFFVECKYLIIDHFIQMFISTK